MTPPKTTVLRVITRLNIGGPARQALLLTKHLASTHPTVLATGTPTGREGELLDPEVPIVRVPLKRPLHPPDDLRATVQLRRLLRTTDARILHTHMAKAGTTGRLAARTLGRLGVDRVRTVHTYHGHVLDGYFRPAIQRAFITIERALARVTDVIIAISPEIRDELLDLGIGRPSQYEIVPLGFDLSNHLAVGAGDGSFRRSLGVAPDVDLVGIVGRLVPIKDHATMFEAMRSLPSVHLAVVGDGELRADLEALAGTLGIADRVHFAGWRLDVPAVMADLDLVALSSRNEGTPVALIEALACGRPVVATDVGGVRSVVSDGANGRIVPAGQPAPLADAIASVLARADRGSALGVAGRERVRTHFGQARLLTDIAALYDGLLGAARR